MVCPLRPHAHLGVDVARQAVAAWRELLALGVDSPHTILANVALAMVRAFT